MSEASRQCKEDNPSAATDHQVESKQRGGVHIFKYSDLAQSSGTAISEMNLDCRKAPSRKSTSRELQAGPVRNHTFCV